MGASFSLTFLQAGRRTCATEQMPPVVAAIDDVIAGARVLQSQFAHPAANRAALWGKLQ